MQKYFVSGFFYLVNIFLLIPMFASGEGFSNPLSNGLDSIPSVVEALAKSVGNILFPIAVLFVVYAGFKYVIAQGNSEKIKEAHKNIFWTLVGVAILLGAWALSALVRGTIDQLQ